MYLSKTCTQGPRLVNFYAHQIAMEVGTTYFPTSVLHTNSAVTGVLLRFGRGVLASRGLWGMLTANNSSFTTLSSAILLLRSSSSEDRRALGQSSVSHRFVASSLRRWKLMAETKTAMRLSEDGFVTKSRPHRAQ